MRKIKVIFEFDEEKLGEKWMNIDNLKLMLYSDKFFTREELLKIVSYEENEGGEMEIDWKIKKDAEPQGSSNGFWYDLTVGGYIKPEEILEDKNQLEKLEDALVLVRSFEDALKRTELLNEF